MIEACDGMIIMDDEISLDEFDLPEDLKYMCDTMTKAAYEGDFKSWWQFDDNIGSFAKVKYLQGEITKECLTAVCQRYRTGV